MSYLEEVYSKCLFKTISYVDVKTQLHARNVNFAPSDSYYILTLKLRRDILLEGNSKSETAKHITEEINALTASRHSIGSRYKCSLKGCNFLSTKYEKYLRHLEFVHQNSSARFVCNFRHHCSRSFPSFSSLKSHYNSCHKNKVYWNKKSGVSVRQNQLVEELIQLRCEKASCGHSTVCSLRKFKAHLYTHTDKKEEVQCLFCSYKSNTSGTLKSHFSRKHRVQTVNMICSKFLQNDRIEGFQDTEDVEDEKDKELELELELDVAEGLSDEDDGGDEFDEEELFVKALAMTFNEWMNVKNLAYSTVNFVVSEIFNSYEKGVHFTVEKIKSKLMEEGIDQKTIQEILEKVDENDPFKKAREELENERNRLRFIDNNFNHVKPITIVLSDEHSSVKESYQYVPINESLKVLLEDQTYVSQKAADPHYYEEDVIKDVRDGSCFQSNKFFTENPEAVPLLLFIDELEVCNPLGAGKTKHKINCSYFSTLHIQSALRSKVNSIQLVSLVTSKVWKKYGNHKVNDRLLSDLKTLESEGIRIEEPCLGRVLPRRVTVKAGLAYIIGDNLGQHIIAELNQAFSCGNICRWCKISYNDCCINGKAYKHCEDGFEPQEWTVRDYDAKALAAEEGADPKDTDGVKRNCVFNTLQSFHSVLQLPPCLGHDFFEGVFAADIQFYLEYLVVKEKRISLEEFNRKLKNVQLTSRDSKNRPQNFKIRKKGAKYEGSAGSLRVLSRIITMILSNVLDDSAVGDLIIKLVEVSELVTAPKLSKYEIENVLYYTVIDYLDLRVEAIERLNMDNVKPKHHFLSHYAELFKLHGPLIHLWAMRMESKHQFFKNVIRTSKNFKHPAMTCAIRHQRAQISHRYNGLFPEKYSVPANTLSVKELVPDIASSYPREFLACLGADALLPTNVTVFGTVYKTGMIVILNKPGMGELRVGVITCIAFDKDRVVFCCTDFQTYHSKHGYYMTNKKCAEHVIVDQSNLADHQPLQRIGTKEKFSFCLHHYVSDS